MTSEIFWIRANSLSWFNGYEVLCDKDTEQEIRDEFEQYYYNPFLYNQCLN